MAWRGPRVQIPSAPLHLSFASMLVRCDAAFRQWSGVELDRNRRPPRGQSYPRRSVECVRPGALLRRLLDGSVTNVSFADAERLLQALGFDKLRVKGSHHVYGRPGIAEQINLQDRGGQAKPYQMRQLVALVRRYDLGVEEDE